MTQLKKKIEFNLIIESLSKILKAYFLFLFSSLLFINCADISGPIRKPQVELNEYQDDSMKIKFTLESGKFVENEASSWIVEIIPSKKLAIEKNNLFKKDQSTDQLKDQSMMSNESNFFDVWPEEIPLVFVMTCCGTLTNHILKRLPSSTQSKLLYQVSNIVPSMPGDWEFRFVIDKQLYQFPLSTFKL